MHMGMNLDRQWLLWAERPTWSHVRFPHLILTWAHRASAVFLRRGVEYLRSLCSLLGSSEARPRPSTTWITFRKAVLSFCPPLSLKIAFRVSEQEQLRFTNNDEACHASFTIHHPGAVPGRWSVLHKNQLSVKYTSLQCLLLWSSSAALYSKSRLRCDITVYHCPVQRGLHWEWVQCTPDEVSKLSYVRIWLLHGDSFCFPNTES